MIISDPFFKPNDLTAISRAAVPFETETPYLLECKLEKDISVIEVNFKENISGFLKAHKWLNSLSDSYLSKTSMGGGSLLEHSHALNLGQLLVNDNIKQLKPFDSNINFLKTKNQYYDYDSKLDFVSGSKLIKIQQNFTTLPVEKNIKIF